MQSLSYEVILWDWNGTLLDDGKFGLEVINGMLRRRGMRVPDMHEHGDLFDFPVIRYYERLGFSFEEEPFEVISQEFVDGYFAGVGGCRLREGSVAVLEKLRQAGYRQSILSASRQDLLEHWVNHFGIDLYFEELLGIDSVHATGKSIRGCEWIGRSGMDPTSVLLIGDTLHDAEVAEKMGIDCWLLEGGHHPRRRLEKTGCPCHASVESIAEALGLVAGKAVY